MKSAVVGLVSTPIQAESLVDELFLADFSGGDVSVLFPDVEGAREFADGKPATTPKGVTVGASAGVVLGGLAGQLFGIGSLTIPGAGAFLAAGPIFTALSEGESGANINGLSGALLGLGFPVSEAKNYAGLLENGRILIAVHTESNREIKIVREIFERADAEDIGVTHQVAAHR